MPSHDGGMSYPGVLLLSVTGIFTFLAVVAAAVYFAGYADDVAEWWAKRYYKAKAVAEVKLMENVGEEKVQGMVKADVPVLSRGEKDSLKKNPVMGEDELEQVSGGLGQEAVKEGLGGVSGKLGGLGKL
ncbi:uncharacterized protein PV07_07535 [Cladophialophora immunda]|uniref:Uncharacterized protein n=1 Tax=Cladophialophora immunda TaxID=569365 RepID=A0A0D2CVZ4_9EURO|nr:uncharacterized protein PV07_07535 [Cladophialophora immunda]KIW27834.1 hypothetical protein PV07_07535 [Cladophialophora immunda]